MKWSAKNAPGLEQAGVAVALGQSNPDVLKPSAWLDFDDNAGHVGQAIVWASGEVEVRASDPAATDDLRQDYFASVTNEELSSILDQLLERLEIRPFNHIESVDDSQAGVPLLDAAHLTCFVIGPIGNRHAPHGSVERVAYEEALRVMDEVIEPAVSRFSLLPVRADTLSRAGEITEQIFRRLRSDDVVIADLTGANANVMYELGLRHTENKLTIPIGEYGRLPFDINMIRTIQFSRSPTGLFQARDELVETLNSGLAGEFDPVTATRVWHPDLQPNGPNVPPDQSPLDQSTLQTLRSEPNDEEPFLDVMAEAEDQAEELVEALAALSAKVDHMGSLANEATAEMEKSDIAGGGMKGRLTATARFASRIDQVTGPLDADVERYISAFASVSAANRLLIGKIEEVPDRLEDTDTLEYAMVVRQLAATTRESLGALAELVEVLEENSKASRVLQAPTAKLLRSLQAFIEAASGVDEWDRRLQALKVPVPPEGWEASFGEGTSDSF